MKPADDLKREPMRASTQPAISTSSVLTI